MRKTGLVPVENAWVAVAGLTRQLSVETAMTSNDSRPTNSSIRA